MGEDFLVEQRCDHALLRGVRVDDLLLMWCRLEAAVAYAVRHAKLWFGVAVECKYLGQPLCTGTLTLHVHNPRLWFVEEEQQASHVDVCFNWKIGEKGSEHIVQQQCKRVLERGLHLPHLHRDWVKKNKTPPTRVFLSSHCPACFLEGFPGIQLTQEFPCHLAWCRRVQVSNGCHACERRGCWKTRFECPCNVTP